MHVLSSHIIAEYKSTAIGCQSCPWSAEQGNFSLPPFAPENLVFTRQVWLYRLVLACSFSIQTLNLVLTHGIPPEFRGGVHIFLPAPHTIGSVPSLSGHAIAYRLRSLRRVRWHRASSPQGSSGDGCCLCITADQMLLCSSLFPHPLLVHSVYVQIIGSIPQY